MYDYSIVISVKHNSYVRGVLTRTLGCTTIALEYSVLVPYELTSLTRASGVGAEWRLAWILEDRPYTS